MKNHPVLVSGNIHEMVVTKLFKGFLSLNKKDGFLSAETYVLTTYVISFTSIGMYIIYCLAQATCS